MNAETTKTKRRKLPEQISRKARKLYRENHSITTVAAELGIPYHVAHHAISRGKKAVKKKMTKKAKREARFTMDHMAEAHAAEQVDYKQKYLKAVAMLIEHGIIEVTLE